MTDTQKLTPEEVKSIKTAIKTLNESGLLEKKANVVGVKNVNLPNLLLTTVESIPVEKEDEIPKEVVAIYNAFVELTEDEVVEEEVKVVEKKETKPTNKNEITTKATTDKKKRKDNYGYTIGSKNSEFIKALQKKPQTMSDIKKAEFNTNGSSFYNLFKKLLADGVAKKEGKILSIIK